MELHLQAAFNLRFEGPQTDSSYPETNANGYVSRAMWARARSGPDVS